ncbi:MAG: thiamine phosphate synthase [Methanoregula sp.]|jgi:thiamine-phosphate pyrophosphorylase
MSYDLYVITDEEIAGGLTHEEITERAIAGGADAIQLRDKHCRYGELARTADRICHLCKKTGTIFIVNDRLDVALACGADGVHLGQDDMGVDVARQLAPPAFIIGVSVGNAEEAIRAEQQGASYVALSPTFSTGSKNDAGPGHGLNVLWAIHASVSIPVVAIGGITTDNVGDVIAAGADGIAVISAVVGKRDIAAAARELKTLIMQARQVRHS